MALKITYATMSADNEELNSAFETAVADVQSRLGQSHGVIVNGDHRTDRETFEEVSPIDHNIVVGRYAQATTDDVDDVISAARAFAPEWEACGWDARRDLMLTAAVILAEQILELSALMSYDSGHTRPAPPGSDPLALAAIRRLRANLRDSADPENIAARTECMLAAWMSIFGVRNVGMRLSHPLGHQIGARWNVPHGVTSCIVLPEVMRFLAPSTADAQFRIAEAFGNGATDSGQDSAADAVEAMIRSLDVPTKLSETGAVHEELPDVARA